MQSDRRLVQHIAHALQVGAELCGQPDALRLATGQRGRGAIERQIAQADFDEKVQAPADFGHDVARDCQLPARQRQAAQPAARLGNRHRTDLCNAAFVEAYGQRNLVKPLSGAGRAGRFFAFVPVVPAELLPAVLGAEPGEPQPGAEAVRTPAVFGVVREQAWVRLGKGPAARWAGAVDRKQPMLELGALLALQRGFQMFERPQDLHDAVPVPEPPGVMAGVEWHANIADNILLNRLFMVPSPTSLLPSQWNVAPVPAEGPS